MSEQQYMKWYLELCNQEYAGVGWKLQRNIDMGGEQE